MNLSIAIDGSTERNLLFYEGDEEIIILTVFSVDGDTVSVSYTDPQITTYPRELSFPVGEVFTVPETCRLRYRLMVTIGGVVTHLCSGSLTVRPSL